MNELLALAASLLWGGSDFLGGTLSRRLPAGWVVGLSQGLSLLGLLVVAAVAGGWARVGAVLPWAAAAGVVGVVALFAFYRALALGTMGVVAPIAATGAALPVVVGVVTGERPAPVQLVGIVAAVVGVVLASGPQARGGRTARLPLLLAVVAAGGFGAVIVLVAGGAQHGVVMTLLLMRVFSVATLALPALLAHRRPPAMRRGDLPALAVTGAGDAGANALYAVATTTGGALLSLVAVLASLYPAVTVLLARYVHGERLRPVQGTGVVAALTGVVLIALGGGAG